MSKVSILYIDDDPLAHAALKQMLDSDYHLHGCTDPNEALAQALRIQPALILLDIRMPHVDGSEVLELLKSLPGTRNIPVLAYSSNIDQGTLSELIRRGIRGVLDKTASEGELRDSIGYALAHPAPLY